MGLPPSEAGAMKSTVASVSPRFADTALGDPGARAASAADANRANTQMAQVKTNRRYGGLRRFARFK
jgi:hypothetical protein